jgi:hypothetical protein
MLYSEPRFTKDLDVWVEASNENSVRVFDALARFGAPLAGLGAADFAQEGCFYQVGIAPARVDILMSIEGVTFAEAWPNRTVSRMGSVDCWFIGKQELIRNKRAVGRVLDLVDAERLEQA